MVAAATARGSGCGNANFRNWPTNSASTSWSATCLTAPASGTKLSTGSSPSSARIDAPSPLSAIGDCRADLRHHHQNRPHGALRTRYWPILQRHCRLRRRDGLHQHQTRRIPRRLELLHLTQYLSAKLRVYFLTAPKRKGTASAASRILDCRVIA